MVFEELKKIINEIMDIPMDEIELESHLYDEMDADSLDMSQIVLALENKYSIDIDDEVFEEFETVGNIVEYIKNTIA
ncbi:MAG: acyl carrier protein [Anaeromicrobium sp.]|jgi:acyl carrier protein|uniref:acyl carrier protein n=1 Tax=Anaeromicrobium sp. TaxID=1929132 RepID=UPI0025FC046C|nr:acyl carrier protein [Anaeromicrobium sp.]MCT4593536.1 acyl carrier protein [Anaeromicrobium sp.]